MLCLVQTKRFQKKIEDFTCEHCGRGVEGSGFTNHCPGCLWSKHVDENPGDRASRCGGMMEPVSLEIRHGEERILHRCVVCGHEKYNERARNDSFEAIAQVGNLEN